LDFWIGLISLLVGAGVGTATTLITTRQRVDMELRAASDRLDMEQRVAYDRELRTLRVPHYQALHSVSERLPREWRPGEELTRRDLLALRRTFHEWYFGSDAGGMFLTEAGRKAYFDLIDELQVVGRQGVQDGDAGPVIPEESKRLLELAHELRQQLRQDLGTAEAPKVAWTARGATPAAPPAPAPPPGQGDDAGGR
jgi:hypothetical protein